ncbi:MAG: NusG domain II-containing protein [Clostridia bacterium]|nr:NusG domain II-containing protein [Clostridia bacterium]
MLKKGDLFLIAAIVGIVALSYVGMQLVGLAKGDVHRIAVIKKEDKEIKRIDLDTVEAPYKITLSGAYNEVILVEKGRIRFDEADCPDKVCVKTGWLSKRGDAAVCIPDRTMIKIEGNSGEVDSVTF